MLATPAAAGWGLPCRFGGCSITLHVSRIFSRSQCGRSTAEAALMRINAYRTNNRRKPGCPAMSVFLAPRPLNQRPRPRRSRMGHDGSDGSKPMQRAARAGYRAKIASENVASGQKSFSDVMRSWEGSSGHRENLLRPEVTAVGVAMAKNSKGWPSRTSCSVPKRLTRKKNNEQSARWAWKKKPHAASTAH